MSDIEQLSPRWRYAVIATFILGFAVLILLTFKAYQNAPPIPARVIDASGAVVFTGDDVRHGQEVFLKYGLMDNGTLWGHGGYLGPDFGATVLHDWALALGEQGAQARHSKNYSSLSGDDRAAVDAEVAHLLKTNRYDPHTDTLTIRRAGAQTFQTEIGRWQDYFRDPRGNGGLPANLITDPQQLHDLTAFFTWAAWGSAAVRPATNHSYTNNFPYDPLAGNHPTGAALLWTAISFIFLLGGTAIVLLAFGKFDYLGWRGAPLERASWELSASQQATLKYMAVAATLLLAQTLFGAGVAHYRADPGTFYGIDLSRFLPSNLLRTWHLQSAIFWIATSYVAGALFVGELLGRSSPRGQRLGIHLLFGAIALVIVGSMLGEWAGMLQWLPRCWFWFGDQGWEYLEIGRFWQILLAIGLLFWFFLVWRAVAPARNDPERRGFANFFLIAAFAIPLFYLPALFYGSQTNYTIVDAWRFWIIHLWVEGLVPLTLITLDAWDFVRVTRGREAIVDRHRWAFYFLMAVGFWNFLGAGVFGFLINTPIVSYYEVGTILTPNHGHAAMMGVFGMLGAGLMTFVLRETVSDDVWSRLSRLIRVAFWGLNIGLAMMVVLSLFPGGIMQVRDVIENGYWHARSLAYTATPLARTLEWLRMPGDLVFLFAGALPLAIAVAWGYLTLWKRTGGAQPGSESLALAAGVGNRK